MSALASVDVKAPQYHAPPTQPSSPHVVEPNFPLPPLNAIDPLPRPLLLLIRVRPRGRHAQSGAGGQARPSLLVVATPAVAVAAAAAAAAVAARGCSRADSDAEFLHRLTADTVLHASATLRFRFTARQFGLDQGLRRSRERRLLPRHLGQCRSDLHITPRPDGRDDVPNNERAMLLAPARHSMCRRVACLQACLL